MKNLFAIADEYLRQSDWRDLALIKFCLFSMGVCRRACSQKQKKAGCLSGRRDFAVTYLPLMAKFFGVVQAERSLQCVKQSKEE